MPDWFTFRSGKDPDPRFTLANERTYLAWLRTATAFVASGVGLEAFAGEVLSQEIRTPLAAVLLIAGGVIAVASFVHWIAAERALRTGRPLPVPIMMPIAGAVLVLCASTLVLGLANS
jgi:putative membrane protein